MEREGVVNIDDVNLDQAFIPEEAPPTEDAEPKMKQKRPYKRKGQARIKDTTQSKKLKAEKKKARKAMKEKVGLNRKFFYELLGDFFRYILRSWLGSVSSIITGKFNLEAFAFNDNKC